MNKLFKNNNYRILEIFMERPNHDFSIRGIARELKLNHATVINHVAKLLKADLIIKNQKALYPTYYANSEQEEFQLYKRNASVYKIVKSGVLEHIKKKLMPESIILFGSSATGTYDEKSDIDIFIEGERQNIDLSKFEKAFKKEVNLLFEPRIGDLPENLRNNILNGVVLSGFIRLKHHETKSKLEGMS